MRAPRFLPATPEEARSLPGGFDFLLITGDAYVDHPTFANALVGRYLESLGFKVVLAPQPDWNDPGSLEAYGVPRLAVLVSGGNVDSMVANYTSERHRRSRDLFSPGGQPGLRPDRAVMAYVNLARRAFKGLPVIIGGIEASLRRLAHYDYWSDKVRRSILVDSKADLLIYGMGERSLMEVAQRLAQGQEVRTILDVRGTCVRVRDHQVPEGAIRLPSYDQVSSDPEAHCEAFRLAYLNSDPFGGRPMVQDQDPGLVLHNPPPEPLSTRELDRIYQLPFVGLPHPRYRQPIPALEEVRFSVTAHRGCIGDCSFCAIGVHQGKNIQPRSIRSVVREVQRFLQSKDFKGVVSDVGGPSANFHQMPCSKADRLGVCQGRSCLRPNPCPNLEARHREYFEMLRAVRSIPGVKRVFVRSGVRYDYLMMDHPSYLRELCEHHVSGQMRVAPEHLSDRVTEVMNKPPREVLLQFMDRFRGCSGGRLFLVHYIMTSHPGCTLEDAVEMAVWLKRLRIRPREVQDFTPTPMTRSTCMYATGMDPMTGRRVHVPKGRERRLQRALAQYWVEENRPLVEEALRLVGRTDLIGDGPQCLIPGSPGGSKGGRPKGIGPRGRRGRGKGA
ncbi:YgiQ family radical SAM protein [Thermanaerovibrio acidaminovorans]|uniref:Radical SAM domain protein n=1 Tax=Thermanaerovibrio acidaminovorans (strain ATCC 49978 / DSM 6589 / Su883) TaxID=525903 RepID=D1B6J9_THEAS|nr:YgiQ family radical SAM protein [Thermanaerovibrio acidaminovorans]ACZ19640.1 Radical SAM domain protein [Thermanaerovibrio acidaminovorans DSM 6589]